MNKRFSLNKKGLNIEPFFIEAKKPRRDLKEAKILTFNNPTKTSASLWSRLGFLPHNDTPMWPMTLTYLASP